MVSSNLNDHYDEGAADFLARMPAATDANHDLDRGRADYRELAAQRLVAIKQEMIDEIPWHSRWLGRLIIRRPYLGIWASMAVPTIMLWVYTVQGIRAAGWLAGGIFLAPLAVMGSLLALMISMFAYRSRRFNP